MAARVLVAIALATATAVTLSAAPAALAAEPPTILSAGIDGADRLFVTWSLGAGTAYDRAAFATSPRPHPFLAGFFADANDADSDCALLPGCVGTPATTSYVGRHPVARDRRYFVEVSSRVGEDEPLTSAVWVIDEAMPLREGAPPVGDSRRPANRPASGRLFAPAPSSSLTVLKLPATISAVLSSAVRVRVRCTASCDVDLRLSLDGRTLARRTGRLPGGASPKLELRPAGAARVRLRARSRARLTLAGTVTPLGGPMRRVRRSFTVRR